MKKFSRTATAALGVVAALGVAACHPPGEVDSFDTSKKDNASTFTGRTAAESASATTEDAAAATTTESAAETTSAAADAELPQYIDCAAAPAGEPAEISLNCVDNSDALTNIEWTQWTEESATGTATRVTDGETTENVTVELSNPEESTQGVPVFTVVTVDGQQVEL